MKTVLELAYNEAKDFFLKEESYFSVELPDYFNFQDLLNNIDKELNGRKLKEIGAQLKVRDLDGVITKLNSSFQDEVKQEIEAKSFFLE